MAIRSCFVLTASLISFAAFANDAPPSDASIQELTTLAHSQEVYRGMKSQLDAMITSSMKEAAQGQTITPERQAVLDRVHAKMVAATIHIGAVDGRLHVRRRAKHQCAGGQSRRYLDLQNNR